MTKNRVLRTLFIILISSLVLTSCQKPNQPTETQFVHQVKMQIASARETPAHTDSTYYIQRYVAWNASAIWDTLKADSLANWFTSSPYKVTDMWFVGDLDMCGRPVNTENFVTIKLASPDSKILSLGFQPKPSGPFDYCYQTYMHYTFIGN